MANFKIFKETSVPASMVANSIYLIAPESNPDHLEIYVTNNAGDASRHTKTVAEIQNMIDSTLATHVTGAEFVADIAERDALTGVLNAQQVIVEDATGDATVSSGAATYLYKESTDDWIKLTEHESLDVVLSWAALQDKPVSTAASIDIAVSNTHTHSNKAQLDQYNQDADGAPVYAGVAMVQTGSLNW